MGKKDQALTLLNMPLQEAANCSDEKGLVPAPVQLTCDFLRTQGLETEGLFRKAGNNKRIDTLLQDISTYYLDKDSSQVDNPERILYDLLGHPLVSVHDAANALLRYLRNLPEPLLSNQYIPCFCQCVEDYQEVVGDTARLSESKDVKESAVHVDALQLLQARMQYMITKMLPPANRETLMVVIQLCTALSEKQEVNMMTPANIGVCIGMTVATPTVLQLIIEHHNIIIPMDDSKKFSGAVGYKAILGLDFNRKVENMRAFTLSAGSSATDGFNLGTLTFAGSAINTRMTMEKKGDRPTSWMGVGRKKEKHAEIEHRRGSSTVGRTEDKERKGKNRLSSLFA
eukprot:CFRG4484T1